MTGNLLAFFASAGFGIALTCIILTISIVAMMLPDDERQYMDDPPAFARPFWPLVRIVSYFFGSNLPVSYLDKVDKKLQNNGVSFMVTAEEYGSMQIVLPLSFAFLTAFMLLTTGEVEMMYVLMAAVVGFVLPEVWVMDARGKRDREIVRTLPVFLEYITMCVDAGLNFAGGLKQAVDKGPHGAMRNEFRIVLRDINSGQTRAEALRRFEARVTLKDVSIFVSAVVQAEKMGSSMKNTMLVQVQQRIEERFQRAEKAAMQAPVKLVFPLIVFIFPLTFMILLFPIVVKFIE